MENIFFSRIFVILIIFNIYNCKKEATNANAITNYDHPKILEGGKFIEFSGNHPQLILFNHRLVKRIDIDIDLKSNQSEDSLSSSLNSP